MNKEDWSKIMRGLGLITQIGIVIVVNIGVGFFLGYLLDNYLGTAMIFKLLGLLVGIGSGFYSDYKLIKSIYDDDES